MDLEKAKKTITDGKASLGIEFGSTRIKVVLIDTDSAPIVSGGYNWENAYVDHIWTYSMDDVWAGLSAAYRDMADNVKKDFGVEIETFERHRHQRYDARIYCAGQR